MAESGGSNRVLEPSEESGVLTVSELNARISTVVEHADDLRDVTVVGEVIDCNASEVALYFTLTDGTHSVKCMLWRDRYEDMDVELTDGREVLVGCHVDFWQKGGTLNVKPWLIHPVGDGDQHAALERLRAELADRGWFAPETKQQLPDYPTTVGVVTSRNGDARHDVQDAIHTRYPDVRVVIEHASVQGENAPRELAASIACLDADPTIEVIIAGRGGGSDDDLMAFNTELVADAIFHATTPVVAAVGHRADETIADAVADESAITPTAAGELVVREKADALAEVADSGAALVDAYETHVAAAVADLETALTTGYENTTRAGFDDLAGRLDRAYDTAVRSALTDLRHDLDAAYGQVEHEHETAAAVEAAREDAAGIPFAYKATIAVLLVLLALAILALIIT